MQTNLMAVQKGPTGIQVSWAPPTPLGDTTGYRIYYSGDGSGSVNVSGRSTNNHLLTDLKNGATYTISIVGISEHFFSDSVDYPNSIPLSEFFYKYILLELYTQQGTPYFLATSRTRRLLLTFLATPTHAT